MHVQVNDRAHFFKTDHGGLYIRTIQNWAGTADPWEYLEFDLHPKKPPGQLVPAGGGVPGLTPTGVTR